MATYEILKSCILGPRESVVETNDDVSALVEMGIIVEIPKKSSRATRETSTEEKDDTGAN